jgi:hypothetical protein
MTMRPTKETSVLGAAELPTSKVRWLELASGDIHVDRQENMAPASATTITFENLLMGPARSVAQPRDSASGAARRKSGSSWNALGESMKPVLATSRSSDAVARGGGVHLPSAR